MTKTHRFIEERILSSASKIFSLAEEYEKGVILDTERVAMVLFHHAARSDLCSAASHCGAIITAFVIADRLDLELSEQAASMRPWGFVL